MSSDAPDQPATRERLFRLAEAGRLSPEALERALRLAGHLPDRAAWRAVADRMLLLLGLAFLLTGIVFFFAYNWAAMPPFAKFALIEAGIMGAVATVWVKGLDRLAGQAALFVATVLVGAFLAVFGQVYPTGADVYELFLTWTALITVWVVAGRAPALWLLWLALVNATIIAYWTEVYDPFLRRPAALTLLLFALNAGATAAWEAGAARGAAWMRGRWLPDLTAAAALVCLVIPVLEVVSRHFRFGGDPWRMAAPLVYAAAVAFGLWFYRKRRRDLFLLAALLLSLIIVVTAALGEVWGTEDWMALVLGLIVLAQSAAAAAWLRKVAREGEPS